MKRKQIKLPDHGIKAVFFDLGGVLVESAEWHNTAFSLALLDNGGPKLTEDELDLLTGLSTKERLELFALDLDYDNVYESKQGYMAEIIDANCKPITRIIDTVEYVNSWGPTAVVTNTEKEMAHRMLKKSRLDGRFGLVVTRDDVDGKVKPHQWPYLVARNHFGLCRKQALCIEDTLDGVMSVVEAGLRTWHLKKFEDLNVRNLMNVISSYRITI